MEEQRKLVGMGKYDEEGRRKVRGDEVADMHMDACCSGSSGVRVTVAVT